MSFESQAVRDARIDVGAVLGAVAKRLPRIVLLTLLLLAAAFAILMFMPRLYESSSSILVEPRSNAFMRLSNEQTPTMSSSDAGVVSSQIELIKSRDTLLGVIKQLDLRLVPEFNGGAAGGFNPLAVVGQLLGRSATPVSVDEVVLGTLYDRLTVAQERDSRLISVRVQSTDPQRAADIANAIANAHVTRRAQLSLSDTAEASGWLRDEIERLRIRVKETETAVAQFKVDNDLYTGPNSTSLLDQQLSTLSTQLSAAQERKNVALSRAAMIRGMLDRGQAIDSIADVGSSAAIQRLSEEKARLQGERALRSASLLANHPTMQAMTAQIAELDRQMGIEARRVASAFDAEAQIEAGLEEALQADLDRAKATASTATQDNVTLDSLQRDAKAQRDLLEGYLQRYNEASSLTDTNSALPDVRVVSMAAAAVSPASPKTAMVLMAVGIVAVALQVGGVVFSELVSGRAIVPGREWQRAEVAPAVAELPERHQVLNAEPAEAVVAVDAEIAMAEDAEDVLMELEVDSAPEADVSEPMLDAKGNDDDVDLAVDHEQAGQLESDTQPELINPSAETAFDFPGTVSLADLCADLVMGRTHMVVLAAHRTNAECEALAEDLVGDALARGLSVAVVDAGSGRLSDELGLTDLSVDAASFGDVVHKSADNSFAEVPWGQGRSIDRLSTKPLTLVEALGDIYEVVVVMTGRVGMSSNLPLFEGLEGRYVLVATEAEDVDAVADTREQLMDAGFENIDVTSVPARAA
jgi:uncharacterized protein involved in exopolysaccharide biosynthesis